MKENGKFVDTLCVWEFDDINECTKFAIKFSEENNIVNSPLWANKVKETALNEFPKEFKHSEEWKQDISIKNRGANNAMFGKNHTKETLLKLKVPKSEEHKQKLRIPKSEELANILRNRNKGRIWITNGIKDSLVIPTYLIPDGWYRGRHNNGRLGYSKNQG